MSLKSLCEPQKGRSKQLGVRREATKMTSALVPPSLLHYSTLKQIAATLKMAPWQSRPLNRRAQDGDVSSEIPAPRLSLDARAAGPSWWSRAAAAAVRACSLSITNNGAEDLDSPRRRPRRRQEGRAGSLIVTNVKTRRLGGAGGEGRRHGLAHPPLGVGARETVAALPAAGVIWFGGGLWVS